MAKKRVASASHGMEPSNRDEVTAKIRDNNQAVTLEEVTEWLTRYLEMCKQNVAFFNRNLESIRRDDERHRLIALFVRQTSIDFGVHAEEALKILEGAESGDVSTVFLEGVRCGLSFERLLSLIDGRYEEKWLHDESRQAGGKNTKLVKTDRDRLLVEFAYAKYRGTAKEYEKTANELYRQGIKGRGGGKLSAKTVSRMVKELEDLDNAKRCPENAAL